MIRQGSAVIGISERFSRRKGRVIGNFNDPEQGKVYIVRWETESNSAGYEDQYVKQSELEIAPTVKRGRYRGQGTSPSSKRAKVTRFTNVDEQEDNLELTDVRIDVEDDKEEAVDPLKSIRDTELEELENIDELQQ
jgi:hypothetical protein